MNRRDFSRMLTVASFAATATESRAQSSSIADLAKRLRPGVFSSGPLNAITDLAGVAVGHTTIIEGDNIRTGATAILPHTGNLFQQKTPGAVYVGNAFGKLAGSTQVNELGNIETPIVLTNTLSVAAGIEGAVRYTLTQPGNEKIVSVNALVGETNDATLNDIRGMRVRPADILAAIAAAKPGPVEQGAVGAGTGTVCFGWKGGIGTASRLLPSRLGGYTVAALLQTNFGGQLVMNGFPIGAALGKKLYSADGSCMIVIATDAPLSHRSLTRLAKRAIFGLARTGSAYSNGSGDFAIAFSTFPGNRVPHSSAGAEPATDLSNNAISPLFEAALEVVEESVYNSLLHATTTTSNGHTIEALPKDKLAALLAKYPA
jgi:D-aminopeptidase